MNKTIPLVRRYIVGLIKHKGTTATNWISAEQIDSPLQKYIYETIHGMFKSGSQLSPELVLDRLLTMCPEPAWKEDIYRIANDASHSDVEVLEIGELREAINRAYIEQKGTKTLEDLLLGITRPGAIDAAIETLRFLKAVEPSEEVSLHDQVDVAIEEAVNGAKGLIPFGIPTLDRKIAGLSRGEVAVYAGRPGMGKTSSALQLAVNWLDQGYKVMILSKEMSATKLIHKLIVNQSDSITADKIKRGDFNNEEKAMLNRQAKELKDKWGDNLIIFDKIKRFDKVEALIAKHRPDILIDDFIQMTEMVTPDQRTEIGRMMQGYKWMAKEYNMTFLVLSQLNRELAKREDQRPRATDLAESGMLEQFASEIIFIHYPHALDQNNPADIVEILVDKARYGERCAMRLLFDGNHMRYSELPEMAG